MAVPGRVYIIMDNIGVIHVAYLVHKVPYATGATEKSPCCSIMHLNPSHQYLLQSLKYVLRSILDSLHVNHHLL
jgi:hypothetical protein